MTFSFTIFFLLALRFSCMSFKIEKPHLNLQCCSNGILVVIWLQIRRWLRHIECSCFGELQILMMLSELVDICIRLLDNLNRVRMSTGYCINPAESTSASGIPELEPDCFDRTVMAENNALHWPCRPINWADGSICFIGQRKPFPPASDFLLSESLPMPHNSKMVNHSG